MSTGFALTDALVYKFTGKDSTRYLHSRLTNDIRGMAPGASCLAAALTPQGKIEVFGSVLRLADSEYIILIDGGDAALVEAALKRFLVADRVQVERLDSFVFHLIGVNTGSTAAQAIVRNRVGEMGLDLIVSKNPPEQSPKFNALSAHEIELRRLRSGIPAYPRELGHDLLFAEADLESALSRTKGCYVGQEVVEKISALGKAPRRLRTFSTARAEIQAQDPVLTRLDGKEKNVGQVLSVIADGATMYGFILVKNQEFSDLSVRGNAINLG